MEKIKDMRTLLDDRRSYSTWLLLHFNKTENVQAYRDSIKEGEPVELSITLNGIEMSRADMDEAMEAITENHLGSLTGERAKLEQAKKDFAQKVEEKAREIIKEQMEDLEQKLYDVKENLDMIDSIASKNISWKKEN